MNILELSDVGNAHRFIKRFGAQVRYCPQWRSWLTWAKSRWALDDSERVMGLARTIAAEMCMDAENSRDQPFIRHARGSANHRKLEDMLRQARSMPGVSVGQDEVDAHPMLLNCLNGTVDLATGELRPHTPTDLLTKIIPINYRADASMPLYDKFLLEVQPEGEMRDYLRRAVGYSLTGLTDEQCLFICYGEGANGKSVFFDVLHTILGDYGQQADVRILLPHKGSSPRDDLAELRGVRLVRAQETESESELAEAVVKQLTGGDYMRARMLYKASFQFKPICKIWMATNHLPQIRSTDLGIWRRPHPIPFEVVIPEESRNQKLAEQLRAEAEGILAWAVRGCLEWQQGGLRPPVRVRLALSAYREDMNTVSQFVRDCCRENPLGEVRLTLLMESYKAWCSVAGVKKPITQKQMIEVLRASGCQPAHNRTGNFWLGLELLSPISDIAQ